MVFLSLVNNIAILVSLSIVHGLIMRRWKQGTGTYQVLSGLLFGGVAIIGMMNPLRLMPGVIFDGRSIIIGVAGLFGGPITAAATACISGAYRIWIGGAGTAMGVSVITESAVLGVIYHYLRKRRPEIVHPLYLLAFGILVHLVMLILTIALPGKASVEVLRMIGVPVITIYPVATLLVCMLFLDQESRIKAEARIQEQYVLLNGILEGTTDAVFVKDLRGRYLVINPIAQKMIARPLEDILGHDDTALFPLSLAHEFMATDQEIMTTGRARLIEDIVPTDGPPRILLVMKSVLRDAAGTIIGLIGVAHDITERKAMEEQLRHAQKLESVGRLAGGVAHDFNNMLSVILGHTDLALASVDAATPVYKDLQQIASAAHRSAELTRQLLAFARKQTVSPKVLVLNESVSSIQAILKRLVGENIELIWSPGKDLWSVLMDPTQIDQILTNLAANARDAIPDVGTVTIRTQNIVVDGRPGTAPLDIPRGNYVVLTFSDTGVGLNQESIKLMFEPFYTTKEVGKGTGLGLATVYGIVKQNNGFIDVTSEPGKGTAITLYLPSTTTPATRERTQSEQRSLPRGDETILLVDDEEAILNLGKIILERCGYTALTARTPQTAIELAKQHTSTIHLLITDVVMPGMSGKELKEHLSVLRPGLKCLYISGYTANVIAQHGVLDENIHFVQKPFTLSALAEAIRNVLAE